MKMNGFACRIKVRTIAVCEALRHGVVSIKEQVFRRDAFAVTYIFNQIVKYIINQTALFCNIKFRECMICLIDLGIAKYHFEAVTGHEVNLY